MVDRWQVFFCHIINVDIHDPQCPWSTISLSTIFTIQSVCPQYPYPRYPQVCDHDPQYLYPQYPQSTMSMTHNILINDIYDPRCHCPWSTMSLSMSTLCNIHEDQQHQMLINKTLVGINIVNYAMQWRPQEVSFPQIVVKRCWGSLIHLLYHPLNYFS